MIGDKLIIKREHANAAGQIADILLPRIKNSQKKFIISIAGESGAGKSEIAYSLYENLENTGLKSVILQQDDYFVYPPKTNAEMRKKNINHVGTSEVHLDLIDQNLQDIVSGKKQLRDRITTETIPLAEVSVVIVDGTYTTLLNNVDCHVFIDRNYLDTRKSRKKRGRELQDTYLEKILRIEHAIISKHKKKSDILVNRDYKVEVKSYKEKVKKTKSWLGVRG
jgi:uridine kinase